MLKTTEKTQQRRRQNGAIIQNELRNMDSLCVDGGGKNWWNKGGDNERQHR